MKKIKEPEPALEDKKYAIGYSLFTIGFLTESVAQCLNTKDFYIIFNNSIVSIFIFCYIGWGLVAAGSSLCSYVCFKYNGKYTKWWLIIAVLSLSLLAFITVMDLAAPNPSYTRQNITADDGKQFNFYIKHYDDYDYVMLCNTYANIFLREEKSYRTEKGMFDICKDNENGYSLIVYKKYNNEFMPSKYEITDV